MEIKNSLCLLQYTIAREGCHKVLFEAPSHGNSKTKRKPFYPTKKSTLQGIKDELSYNSAAAAFTNIPASAGGVLNAREPGDLPTSRKQLHDMKRMMRKVDEIGDLLQTQRTEKNP